MRTWLDLLDVVLFLLRYIMLILLESIRLMVLASSSFGGKMELSASWLKVLARELDLPYFKKLLKFLEEEYRNGEEIYPPKNLIFNALNSTPYEEVKVVIVGQDPYHGVGQAHGLAFSVNEGIPLPPSLRNIYKELENDLKIPMGGNGSLQKWADQGVLLLNATLTVRKGKPLSHHKKGWELFTDAIVRALGARKKPVIFVLWGKSAETKMRVLTDEQKAFHHFLVSSHPSPLSAYQGFLGCRHFSTINSLLGARGEKPIDWSISSSS